MKNVFINAYTNFNLGDDLFIKILCERYPDTNFFLYAPKDYKVLFRELNNLKIIPSDNKVTNKIDSVYKKIKGYSLNKKKIAKKCDATVYIGGSLFIQNDNWQEKLIETKNLKLKEQPFFLLGSNFGPFKDKQYYLTYKEIFKNYTDICFREEYSYDLFKELSNVRLADDVIFQLPVKKINHNQHQKKNIVISVIKPSARKNLQDLDNIYYEKIKETVTYFIDKGFIVNLVSFCEPEGDKEAVDEIFRKIPEGYKEKVKKNYYRMNISEILNTIGASDFVIATRFHSMILGWLYEKPVYPLIYSNKMLNVMDDVNFRGSYSDLKNIKSLSAQDVYDTMNTNFIDVSKQIKGSEKQFLELDKFLLK